MSEEQQQPHEVSLEERLEQVDSQLLLFRSLIKSPGWEELAKILRAQAELRANDILGNLGDKNYEIVTINDRQRIVPIDGMARALKTEFEKGVRAGMLLAADIPRATEELLTKAAEKIREQIAEEEGDVDE